jgi:hypothetical protein
MTGLEVIAVVVVGGGLAAFCVYVLSAMMTDH